MFVSDISQVKDYVIKYSSTNIPIFLMLKTCDEQIDGLNSHLIFRYIFTEFAEFTELYKTKIA